MKKLLLYFMSFILLTGNLTYCGKKSAINKNDFEITYNTNHLTKIMFGFCGTFFGAKSYEHIRELVRNTLYKTKPTENSQSHIHLNHCSCNQNYINDVEKYPTATKIIGSLFYAGISYYFFKKAFSN